MRGKGGGGVGEKKSGWVERMEGEWRRKDLADPRVVGKKRGAGRKVAGGGDREHWGLGVWGLVVVRGLLVQRPSWSVWGLLGGLFRRPANSVKRAPARTKKTDGKSILLKGKGAGKTKTLGKKNCQGSDKGGGGRGGGDAIRETR